jgi:CDGSH-type Zn-finger protein
MRGNRPGGKESKINQYKIKVTANGPYIVLGGVPLTVQRIILDADGQCLDWSQTKKYPKKKTYSLCRCGKSKSWPFCDSTHKQINFEGIETANRLSYLDQCKKYGGPALELTDVKSLCAHVGFCDRAGGTWNLISRSDEPEARKIAIEEGCNCPSGRLVVWDQEGRAIEPISVPFIGLIESPEGEFIGSIWVRGGIPIESDNGETYEIRNRVTLCGCGRSSNKPFCDGSHRQK